MAQLGPLDTSVADELKVMGKFVTALDKVDPGAASRIVVWLFERYHKPLEDEKDPFYDEVHP
jgi:hypothetical protein